MIYSINQSINQHDLLWRPISNHICVK